MEFETHRRALRDALPWILAALLPLLLSVALPATLASFVGESVGAWIGRASTWLGAIGSGAMLLGALRLARARLDGGLVPAFVLAFVAWAAEFALRMFALSSAPEVASGLLAVRLVAASVGMAALCGGMARVLGRQGGHRQASAWRFAQLLFAAFTALLAVAFALARWLAPEGGLWEWIASLPLGASLAWLAFAAPWAWLVPCVRRSVRFVARPRSVSEILTG